MNSDAYRVMLSLIQFKHFTSQCWPLYLCINDHQHSKKQPVELMFPPDHNTEYFYSFLQ